MFHLETMNIRIITPNIHIYIYAMILRIHHLALLKRQLSDFPVVALLGARQVGKTTLARQLAQDWDGPKRYFDLEDPDDQARLTWQPKWNTCCLSPTRSVPRWACTAAPRWKPSLTSRS